MGVTALPLRRNACRWRRLHYRLRHAHITDDKTVEKLLSQLGLPNLFAQAVEHDEVRLSVVFDNHPTHWLVFDYFKGGDSPEKNGLSFNAYPKVSTPRAQMLDKLQAIAKRMSVNKPFTFSQIPILEKKASTNQTATREVPAS